MTELSGWGRYPRHATRLLHPATPRAVQGLMAQQAGLIARGNGRAYGDAAIGAAATLGTGALDRIRAFDRETGRIRAEAGLLLCDLLALAVPLGLFPPVVPGTMAVTLGGMAAADVHGKNHHRDGGFGDHVEALTLALPGGGTLVCGPNENAAVFRATIGGMGLTGTILDLTFRLRPIATGWIRQNTVATADLDATLAALAAAGTAPYCVAWIDTLARGAGLGRGLVFAGEHAALADLAAGLPTAPRFPAARPAWLAVPCDLPSGTLNRLSVAAFNALYFRAGARQAGAPVLVPWDRYFFPLDAIGGWNRIYGRRGFLQYQFVVPGPGAGALVGAVIERVSHHGAASFLSVLKQLGPGHGALSFPMEGLTLTLDLPAAGPVFALLDELDRLVVAAGGRLYLAKDARQAPATFAAGYPGLPGFQALRRDIGAPGRIASRLSERLAI